MADNTAKARKSLDGHRKAVRDHIGKWERYESENDKKFALKTIANAQKQIAALRSAHPSLTASWEDSWHPRR